MEEDGYESNRAMKPDSSEQVVFAEVLLRDTPEARASFLDAACGTGTALRQRVEALLRAAENEGFLRASRSTVSGGHFAAANISLLSSAIISVCSVGRVLYSGKRERRHAHSLCYRARRSQGHGGIAAARL
jgi:hypothetical protein